MPCLLQKYKVQSLIFSIPPILTRDQCEILSEGDNIVSNNNLTLKDLVHTTRRRGGYEKWLYIKMRTLKNKK